MKKTFIIANWKSNKTTLEAKNWLQEFPISNFQFPISEKEIIICASFTHLPVLKHLIVENKLPISLGAQNISPFDEGAYTGEVSAKQIKEFAEFVLIGHSERRKNFMESDEMLFKKVELTNKYELTPIYCIQGTETKIPSNISIIAYEPISAIGTGHPDTPENAQDIASFFKKNHNVEYVLYGGSVTSKNVKEFTKMPDIDGVLIGGASLDAQEFYTVIKNA